MNYQKIMQMREPIAKHIGTFSFTPETAPTKMRPHILGDKACSVCKEKFEEIKEIFENKKDVKNDYVFSGKKEGVTYFFKRKRVAGELEKMANPLADAMVTPDSPAYRVRKAAKIERIIKENGYEKDVIVPKKYLFWDENQKEWYAVAEAVDLDDAVVSISKDDEQKLGIEFQCINEGQVLARKMGKKKKDLSERQAEALAKLAFEAGYTDQSYNNFFFDKKGRVAIIDTEAFDRGTKKIFRSYGVLTRISDFLFTDWSNRSVRAGLLGTAKLKMFSKKEAAREAVKAVENKHFIWTIALTIGKIALTILAIKAIPVALALTAMPTLCIVALKVVSVVAHLKVVAYIWNLGTTSFLFYQGRQGYTGIQNIQALQLKQVPLV